jgi:hypothetical protein
LLNFWVWQNHLFVLVQSQNYEQASALQASSVGQSDLIDLSGDPNNMEDEARLEMWNLLLALIWIPR